MKPAKKISGQLTSIVADALQWRVLNTYFREFGNIASGQQFTLATLMSLHENGWFPTVTQLARVIALPRSTVSRHVSQVIKAGLVYESVDSRDRRRRLLRPTSQGNKLRAAVLADIAAALARVFELQDRSQAVNRREKSLDDMLDLIDAQRTGREAEGGSR